MSFEVVSRPHVESFIAWAKDKPEVVVLTADLTNSCEVGLWRDTYPDRFFSLGMAEQNLLSFAGGLAREGYTPFVHTFSVFLYRRAYDQLAMSIAYPNLRVRLVGFLPGLTTPGGATHQAIEDIAIMRATPNMTVLEVGDATDVETVLDVAQSVPGPVYLRMLRGDVPRLFPASDPLEFDRARVLSDGDDVTIFSAGIETEHAMVVARALAESGIGVRHLHISTHKPFGDPQILSSAARARVGVVTVENHTVVGGLGSAVAEVMAEGAAGKRLVRVGIGDTYAHGGSRQYLLAEYGLDASGILRAVESLLGSPTGIVPSDLDRLRMDLGFGAASRPVNAEDSL